MKNHRKKIAGVVLLVGVLVLGISYYYLSVNNNGYCNYKAVGLNACDDRMIILSGNEEMGGFVGQHSIDTAPSFITGDDSREKQSYLTTEKYGDIKLLYKEEIVCPGKTTVEGILRIGESCSGNLGKVCDGAPTILVSKWKCE